VTINIAIDCMGGDHGLPTTLPAACHFAQANPNVHLFLVGKEEEIRQGLTQQTYKKDQITLVHANDVISMDDAPLIALRRKKDSSLHGAMNLVKSGEAHACISAGNTGALMAVAQVLLRTLDGIDRAALATAMPNSKGKSTTILDLGANVDCNAIHLLQFGIMGSALVSVIDGIERPTVGLLNVGQEDIKGNEVVKKASELLRQSALNFIGNVEGDDIFHGTSDVVVCDGFVGNVVLKAVEGLAKMIKISLEQSFRNDPFSMMLGAMASPTVLKRFKNSIDPARYNGACLLGVKGIVFKSHGSAKADAFECALNRTYEAANNKLLDKISQTVQQSLTTTAIEPQTP
jgi:phosphate acyltransferase